MVATICIINLFWFCVLLQNLASYPDDDEVTINDNTVSIWGWLAMVNATDKSFYNELYCPDIYTQ